MRKTLLGPAVLTAGLAVTLLGAGAAHASPPPSNSITIHNQTEADALPSVVTKNVDIPATVTQADNVWLSWRTFTGNITVEGYASMASDYVGGNVTVSGPGSFLALNNQASHIHGNLVVQNSSGSYQGMWKNWAFGNWTQYPGADLPTAQSQVDGRFDFLNNTSVLYVGYPLHVTGKFTYTGNDQPWSSLQPGGALGGQWGLTGGLSVDGQQVTA